MISHCWHKIIDLYVCLSNTSKSLLVQLCHNCIKIANKSSPGGPIMTRSYLRSNKHKMMLINLTTNFSALKKCLLSIVCLCQARAMATARGTGTARPPPPPPSPARPPPPCPCRQGATQGRPAQSTCTPSGTSALGSGPRPTPSTRRTTRWGSRFLL